MSCLIASAMMLCTCKEFWTWGIRSALVHVLTHTNSRLKFSSLARFAVVSKCNACYIHTYLDSKGQQGGLSFFTIMSGGTESL